MTKKVIIVVSLVSESEDVDDEQIKREIRESLKCDWLAEVERVTVRNDV
jgi:translation elongation factor EF-1beta